MNLFKKVAVCTDIHFGLKSNSLVHNQDCEQFIDWFIETAKAQGCETGMFLGDWHHHRASINLQTLNFSLRSLEKLSAAFERFYFIPGNHDLYYRDKRDIQSAEWARHIPNIEIINDFYKEGDVSIVPWLVGDDHKKLGKISAKYMFGHLELPHFYMNAMVAMPDTGEIKEGAFNGVEKVFTGHFHKRQTRGNITYMGNCFPHNYADAGDDARGMMIIEWGQDPVFHTWPGQPRYRVYNLSDVLRTPENLLLANMHCRVNLDIDISYEEATFIKETFVGTYNLRELTLLPVKNADIGQDIILGNIKFESIDSIVTSQLTNIASDHYDPNLLLDIYRHL
jgi:DNA repair exonuclease SbcCD nuclease subunit